MPGELGPAPGLPDSEQRANHIRDNSLELIREVKGKTWPDQRQTVPPEQRTEIIDHYHEQLSEVLALPRDEQGINRPRLDGYLAKIGLQPKDTLFLGINEYDQADKIVGNKKDKDERGAYMRSLDVAIIKRHPAREHFNSTELAESVAVHEAAHAAAHTIISYSLDESGEYVQGKPWPARTGHIVGAADGTSRGRVLEESYSEYERGLYVRDVLKRPGGFVAPAGEQWSYPDKPYISGQYFYKINDHKVGYPVSAEGATALGLLVDNDPALIDVLRLSRTSVEAKREVARRIDAVQPGLYAKLRDLEEDSENDPEYDGYHEAYQFVTDALAAAKVEKSANDDKEGRVPNPEMPGPEMPGSMLPDPNKYNWEGLKPEHIINGGSTDLLGDQELTVEDILRAKPQDMQEVADRQPGFEGKTELEPRASTAAKEELLDHITTYTAERDQKGSYHEGTLIDNDKRVLTMRRYADGARPDDRVAAMMRVEELGDDENPKGQIIDIFYLKKSKAGLELQKFTTGIDAAQLADGKEMVDLDSDVFAMSKNAKHEQAFGLSDTTEDEAQELLEAFRAQLK